MDGRVIEGKLGSYTMPSPPQWIGGGSSANVFLAVNQATNEKVAVKAIDRDSLEESARKRTLLTRELNITTKLRDPNIINLMEVIFDDNYVMLVMEFAADPPVAIWEPSPIPWIFPYPNSMFSLTWASMAIPLYPFRAPAL